MFRIIGRAPSSFHLAVLQSIYMQTKKPPLCRQKEFVFSLGLQWEFFFRHTALIGQLNRSCACVFLIGLFRSTTGYIFFIVFFRTLILTFYALGSVKQKAFSICRKMFAFFKATFNFCTAKKSFTLTFLK